jgi:hypothetical protein
MPVNVRAKLSGANSGADWREIEGPMPTTTANHQFTVKEGGIGEPFIMFELASGSELPVLGGGFLTFNLRDGTTLSRAHEIAEMLNRSITGTAYTRP